MAVEAAVAVDAVPAAVVPVLVAAVTVLLWVDGSSPSNAAGQGPCWLCPEVLDIAGWWNRQLPRRLAKHIL